MAQERDNLELQIVALLLKQRNHVRGVAKILHQSHSTVQRKLSILKSHNVIDSMTEGKNKVFFLKHNLVSRSYCIQAEIQKLITLLRRHPQLGIIFEEIACKSKERFIILFGSYAKGLEKKESDIDIYIETTKRAVKKTVEEIHSAINVKIGPFDPQSLLIKEIIKDHVIIRGIDIFYDKTRIFE